MTGAVIPVCDPSRIDPDARLAVFDAARRVIEGTRYILGENVSRFERAFAAYCGVRRCVGTGNGTDALEIALRAAGIGAGDRVAHVANAGFYGTTALRAIGAIPVFIDVDPETQSIDPSLLRRRLECGEVKAVLVTHLFGRLAPMDQICAMADALNIVVVEDCCQAHGAQWGGRLAGSFGRAAAFSFYPTKNLGALGDGGAVLTNDEGVAERALMLRQYGWAQKYHVAVPGGRNSRLDEVQAAILCEKLAYLTGWNQRRRQIAEQYRRRIVHPAIAHPPAADESDVVHLYVIRSAARDQLAEYLRRRHISSDIHYPVPDHRQTVMPGNDALPVTEDLASRILSLPCFPGLTDDEVDRVIDALNEWGS